MHLGRETLGAETFYSPVAPSAVRSPREPTAPRAMSDGEVDAMVEAFAPSAATRLTAGFDGFELHAAHGYLLAQFLSPWTQPAAGDARPSPVARGRVADRRRRPRRSRPTA